MPTILPNDTSLHFPSVIVVDASAGSGKTTTLTHRLVQLLLSKRIPLNNLSNILAITFTNNAAVEMKRRVLALLKAAALGEKDAIASVRGLVTLSDADIQRGAKEVLETILDQYSDFQVQTIDSFLSRVFKASALEFGFPPGFDIVIDSRPLVDEAFETFAAGIFEGTREAAMLESLAHRLLLTRSSEAKYHWNPYKELAREVKNLYGKIVSTARPLIHEDRSREYEEKAKRLCGLVEELGLELDRSNLVPATRFLTYRKEARTGKVDRLLDLQFPNPPAAKGKSPKIEFARFLKSSEGLCAQIESLRSELILLHSRTYFEPYVRTHDLLQETLDAVKRRQGTVDLGDMTLRLARFMKDGNVPDLYLSLGERIQHYLIDEFQDTSPIQWATLTPLIENSLSASGSLFVVGDMKQSIYGFRGADWRIMKDVMSGRSFPSAPPEVLTLEINYRSGGRIVEFGKQVFHEIVPFQVLSGAAQESGLATFRQKPRPGTEKNGVVETLVFEGDAAERPEREVILKIVKDCLKRGFALRDLAILTPENEDVVKVSGWLNEQGYAFVPFSTLDIRTRKAIGELLALLRFLDSPIDDLSFGTFLLGDVFEQRLNADGSGQSRVDIRQFMFDHRSSGSRKPLYSSFKERFPDIWEHYVNPLFILTGYLPLYDLTTQIYKRFGVFELLPEEEAALVKLLEVVKIFEEKGINSLAEFIDFSSEISEDSDWNIDVPGDVNAIRVMTVHKAKGLDFGVVIVLLYDVPVRPERVYMEEVPEGVRLVRLVKKHGEEHPRLGELMVDRELKSKVDQLNKLYVALTRAKDELYVLGVQYPQSKEPSSFLPTQGYEPKQKPPVKQRPPEEEQRAVMVHHRLGTAIEGHVDRIHLEETMRGEIVHNVLARIVTIGNDPDTDVRDAIQNEAGDAGMEAERLRKHLTAFLLKDDIAPFFKPGPERTVYAEQDFVRKDGQLFRMDRVVVDPRTVTVIDFKTGEEQSDHTDQIHNYMGILREIYPGRTVRGILAYIDKGMCREC